MSIGIVRYSKNKNIPVMGCQVNKESVGDS